MSGTRGCQNDFKVGMAGRIKIRILFAVILVGGVLLLQAYVFHARPGTPPPDWWIFLNYIPIMLSFATDMGLHLSAQAGFYFGLVVQWSIIGILFADLYLKYAGARHQA